MYLLIGRWLVFRGGVMALFLPSLWQTTDRETREMKRQARGGCPLLCVTSDSRLAWTGGYPKTTSASPSSIVTSTDSQWKRHSPGCFSHYSARKTDTLSSFFCCIIEILLEYFCCSKCCVGFYGIECFLTLQFILHAVVRAAVYQEKKTEKILKTSITFQHHNMCSLSSSFAHLTIFAKTNAIPFIKIAAFALGSHQSYQPLYCDFNNINELCVLIYCPPDRVKMLQYEFLFFYIYYSIWHEQECCFS